MRLRVDTVGHRLTAMTYYLHDLNPVLLDIAGPLKLRWYGLAYVAGFVAARLLFVFFAHRSYLIASKQKIDELLIYSALFAVILGGRLGYMLYYTPGDFFANPLIFFKFHDGGMSSHGGILGFVIFLHIYAWKKKLSAASLGDLIVVCAPLGIFFGRCANFINGELYGRIANGLRWAVQFPNELWHSSSPWAANLLSQANGLNPNMRGVNDLLEAWKGDERLELLLREFLPPRHPSQLYEALLEGLLLFVILFGMRLKWRRLWHGVLTGTFFFLYALARILVEQYREPDSELIFSLTKGQFYSLFMLPIALAYFIYAFNNRKNAPPNLGK